MDSGKKIKWKKKLFRCTKGAISILLCLVMTPFLSISLALVEYARYQQVFQLVDEFEELTGISILSDYDKYIHNRFGLLSVSQGQDMNAIANEYMLANVSALGSQVNLNSTTVQGNLSLADTQVIKKQILDVAETTGLGQVLMEDFNIEKLKEKLLSLSGVTTAIDAVNDVATLTSAVGTAVTTAESLKGKIDELIALLDVNGENSITAKAKDLSQKVYDLFEKFSSEGYSIPETLEGEEWEEILLSLTGDYEEDLIAAFGSAKDVIDHVKSIQNLAGEIPGLVTKLESDVQAVTTAAENIGKAEEKSGGQIASSASATLDDVAKELKNIVTDSFNDIKDTAMNTLKNAASEIVDTALEGVGLADAYDRYSVIADGSYFDSDRGKQDIKKLISLIPQVWNESSPEAIRDEIKNMLVPTIDFSVGNLRKISGDIWGVVDVAKNALTEKVDKKGFTTLIDLVNVVKGLFNLNGIYDPELNANVKLGRNEASAYQSFLSGLSKALKAVEDFTTAMANFDFFKAIKAIADLCSSFGDLFTALGEIVTSMIENISSVFNEGFNGLYERLLLAGYATHNFPNRTDYANALEANYNGAISTTRLKLNGTGLTGFSYNQIARPSSYVAQNMSGSLGINSLASTIDAMLGTGKDTMFKAAEMEFVVAGTSSELANQVISFFNLYFIRLLCSLPAVFVDGEVQTIAGACNIACWVVYILYAIIEPFCDCLLLVNNATVPIVKTDCFLTPSNLMNFVNKLSSACMSKELIGSINAVTDSDIKLSDVGKNKASKGSGLGADLLEVDYTTHLLIMAMVNQGPSVTASRIQTLVKLEATEYYRQKNVKFDWGKTYTSVIVEADVDLNSFFDIGIMNGSGPLQINSKPKQPVGY